MDSNHMLPFFKLLSCGVYLSVDPFMMHLCRHVDLLDGLHGAKRLGPDFGLSNNHPRNTLESIDPSYLWLFSNQFCTRVTPVLPRWSVLVCPMVAICCDFLVECLVLCVLLLIRRLWAKELVMVCVLGFVLCRCGAYFHICCGKLLSQGLYCPREWVFLHSDNFWGKMRFYLYSHEAKGKNHKDLRQISHLSLEKKKLQ